VVGKSGDRAKEKESCGGRRQEGYGALEQVRLCHDVSMSGRSAPLADVSIEDDRWPLPRRSIARVEAGGFTTTGAYPLLLPRPGLANGEVTAARVHQESAQGWGHRRMECLADPKPSYRLGQLVVLGAAPRRDHCFYIVYLLAGFAP